MLWEAITALATLGTGIAIAITVFVGARQLRLTRQTLEHLRRATQLDGALQIFAELNTHEFRESQRFIVNDLAERLKDAEFRRTAELAGAAPNPQEHPELHMMRTLERVGAYVRHGLLDGAIIYDLSLPIILAAWTNLTDLVKIHREAWGSGMWENLEYLAREGTRWRERRGSTYLYLSSFGKELQTSPDRSETNSNLSQTR